MFVWLRGSFRLCNLNKILVVRPCRCLDFAYFSVHLNSSHLSLIFHDFSSIFHIFFLQSFISSLFFLRCSPFFCSLLRLFSLFFSIALQPSQRFAFFLAFFFNFLPNLLLLLHLTSIFSIYL